MSQHFLSRLALILQRSILELLLLSLLASGHRQQWVGDTLKAEYVGDVYIGGLFPIHEKNATNDECARLNIGGLLALEAAMFSLEQVNELGVLGGGLKLGLVALDTCSNEKHAIMHAVKLAMTTINDGNSSSQMSLAVTAGVKRVMGVVGPMHSSSTIQVANILGRFQVPQISYSATSPELSSNERFPYFLRTVPSDRYQAHSLLRILDENHWRYIIGLYEDTSYGRRGFREFEEAISHHHQSICFAAKIRIDLDRGQVEMEEILKEMDSKGENAKAVILYAHHDVAKQFFRAAKHLNFTDRFAWVGTDGWSGHPFDAELNEVVEGAIATNPALLRIPGFEDGVMRSLQRADVQRNPWLNELRSEICSKLDTPIVQSSADEHLDMFCAKGSSAEKDRSLKQILHNFNTEFGYSHFIRNALFAFAYAIGALRFELCGNMMGICSKMRNDIASGSFYPQLLEELKNVSFPGVDNQTVRFIHGRDGTPDYSVMNYQLNKSTGKYEWVEVWKIQGTTSFGDTIQTKIVQRSRPIVFHHKHPSYPPSACGRPCNFGEIREHNPDPHKSCCWECKRCSPSNAYYTLNDTTCGFCDNRKRLQPSKAKNACIDAFVQNQYEDPYVLGIGAFAAIGVIATTIVFALFVAYADTPIVKAASRELSIVLLFGIYLCYGVTFLFVFQPSVFICGLVRFFYGLSYTICYAAIFTKTNRIARIFQNRRPLGTSSMLGDMAHNNGSTALLQQQMQQQQLLTSGSMQSLKRVRYISPLSQVLIVFLLIGFQCLLAACWLVLKPSAVEFETNLVDDDVWIHEYCNVFEHEEVSVVLVYPLILLILSTLYAFKTRKIQGHFNETRYILITSYSTCIVWLAFAPLFFLTKQISIRIFALSAANSLNGSVALLCMFFPKLYIALLRPHKNTRDAVMGRARGQSAGGLSALSQSNNVRNAVLATPEVTKNKPRFSVCSSTAANQENASDDESNWDDNAMAADELDFYPMRGPKAAPKIAVSAASPIGSADES